MLSHRTRSSLPATIALACAAALVAGCGGGSGHAGANGSGGGAGAGTKATRGGPPAVPSSFAHRSFHAADFASPTAGANRWLPLRPGTQWVREGTTLVGHRPVPHRVISTVTSVSRRIDGVVTVAVLDQDIDAGQTTQESLDYLAQNRQGDIWFLGSYTEGYENGRFSNIADAWLSGSHGGRPGLLMPATPTLRTPPWTIAQPPGADPDVAQVVNTGLSQCVPFHCFTRVLVVREGKASAPDNEFKYYAAGVGEILNTPKSASQHKDVERLVNLTRLSRRGLAEIDAEALRLDRHARSTKPSVFARTPAAKRSL